MLFNEGRSVSGTEVPLDVLHPGLGRWHFLLEDLRVEVLLVLQHGESRYNQLFLFC